MFKSWWFRPSVPVQFQPRTFAACHTSFYTANKSKKTKKHFKPLMNTAPFFYSELAVFYEMVHVM